MQNTREVNPDRCTPELLTTLRAGKLYCSLCEENLTTLEQVGAYCSHDQPKRAEPGSRGALLALLESPSDAGESVRFIDYCNECSQHAESFEQAVRDNVITGEGGPYRATERAAPERIVNKLEDGVRAADELAWRLEEALKAAREDLATLERHAPALRRETYERGLLISLEEATRLAGVADYLADYYAPSLQELASSARGLLQERLPDAHSRVRKHLGEV